MFVLDGSHGEGGGQILRSALGLSLVTGRPFRIEKIRAGRARPGLMRQHLTAVRAAEAVGGAEVEGAAIGSTDVTFRPSALRGGDWRFAVGTAGSTTLVLQTILPALALAPAPSTVTLEGGTHNPASPPFDYLSRVFLPLLARMGPRVTATLERPGFYPAGGGVVHVAVEPVAAFGRLDLRERGAIVATGAQALVAALPGAIAERELAVLADRLGWDAAGWRPAFAEAAHGPGNVVATEVVCEHVTERFTGFGQKGVLAEDVAAGVAAETAAWLAAGVPVGPHLADQLLVPMALAGGGSFTTVEPTPHTRSQIELLRRFMGVDVQATEAAPGVWEVVVG